MSTETESVVVGIKKSGLFQTNGFIGGKWIDAFDGNTIEVPAVSNSVVVDGDDAAEMLSSQNKHAAIQKQVVGASLAVESFARRFESGETELPTQQSYMVVLYLVTALGLASQAAYYGHTSKRQDHKIEFVDKKRKCSHDNSEESRVPLLSKLTPSLAVPSADEYSSLERVYYRFCVEKQAFRP